MAQTSLFHLQVVPFLRLAPIPKAVYLKAHFRAHTNLISKFAKRAFLVMWVVVSASFTHFSPFSYVSDPILNFSFSVNPTCPKMSGERPMRKKITDLKRPDLKGNSLLPDSY